MKPGISREEEVRTRENYQGASPTRKQLRRLYTGRAMVWLIATAVARLVFHVPVVLEDVALIAIFVEMVSGLAVAEDGALD